MSDDRVSISFTCMEWATVAAALMRAVQTLTKAEWKERQEAGRCLQEVDRVMRGADEVAPLDDLLL